MTGHVQIVGRYAVLVPAQLDTAYGLVLHQGSLWYPDPKSLEFTFRLSLDDVAPRAAEAAKSVRNAGKRTTAKKK